MRHSLLIILIIGILFMVGGCKGSELATPQELEDLKAAGYDSSWGNPIAAQRTDFDIYRDTPAFDNFSGKTFVSKGGTCLGMDVILKSMYENVEFDPNPRPDWQDRVKDALNGGKTTIYGYKDFRELSEKEPEKLKNLMEVGHFKNFALHNIGTTLGQRLGLEATNGHYKLLQSNLALGKPAVMGLYNMTDGKVLKNLDGGHAMMAYKSVEFENKTVFWMYDPNFEYNEKYNTHRQTMMVYDKKTQKWSMEPSSFEMMYEDLYKDHMTVVSLNSYVDMANTVAKNSLNTAGEFYGEKIREAKEKMDGAWDRFQGAVKRGVDMEIRGAKLIYEDARSAYEKLLSKVRKN